MVEKHKNWAKIMQIWAGNHKKLYKLAPILERPSPNIVCIIFCAIFCARNSGNSSYTTSVSVLMINLGTHLAAPVSWFSTHLECLPHLTHLHPHPGFLVSGNTQNSGQGGLKQGAALHSWPGGHIDGQGGMKQAMVVLQLMAGKARTGESKTGRINKVSMACMIGRHLRVLLVLGLMAGLLVYSFLSTHWEIQRQNR